jgi:hypothetical protein
MGYHNTEQQALEINSIEGPQFPWESCGYPQERAHKETHIGYINDIPANRFIAWE